MHFSNESGGNCGGVGGATHGTTSARRQYFSLEKRYLEKEAGFNEGCFDKSAFINLYCAFIHDLTNRVFRCNQYFQSRKIILNVTFCRLFCLLRVKENSLWLAPLLVRFCFKCPQLNEKLRSKRWRLIAFMNPAGTGNHSPPPAPAMVQPGSTAEHHRNKKKPQMHPADECSPVAILIIPLHTPPATAAKQVCDGENEVCK